MSTMNLKVISKIKSESTSSSETASESEKKQQDPGPIRTRCHLCWKVRDALHKFFTPRTL